MDINPYEPSQLPVGDDPPEGVKPTRLIQRLLAILFWIGGGIIVGGSGIFIWHQCTLVASGVAPRSDIIGILLFILLFPTMGLGMFLFGIDLWGGTKRFARIASVLLTPFAFATIFFVFALIFVLIVSAFTDVS